MTDSLRNWFTALSQRERIFVGVAGLILAVVIAVYAVTLPLLNAIETARTDYIIALERRGAIEVQVTLAEKNKVQIASIPAGSLQQIISQNAVEAGFVIDRADAKGDARTEIMMSKAKPSAVLVWLNDWEGRGIVIERLMIVAGNDGTVAVTATLAKQGS
jgi:general secretion pathway protein M